MTCADNSQIFEEITIAVSSIMGMGDPTFKVILACLQQRTQIDVYRIIGWLILVENVHMYSQQLFVSILLSSNIFITKEIYRLQTYVTCINSTQWYFSFTKKLPKSHH